MAPRSYNAIAGGVCTPGGGRGLQNRWAARKPYRQWVRFPYTSANENGGRTKGFNFPRHERLDISTAEPEWSLKRDEFKF